MFPSTIAMPVPALAGLGQKSFRFTAAEMIETAGGDLGPSRRIGVAGTEIEDGALVTEPSRRGRQLMIVGEESSKILLANFQQLRRRGRLNPRGTRLAT
jgi:hypothetical protein